LQNKLFFIAEIGLNHNGNIDIAKKLIKMAKNNGFNAVKFQKRCPEISTSKLLRDQMRDTPWGYITYLEYRKKIEFGKEEYDEIDRYCKKIGMDWFASAWDLPSFEFLQKYDLEYNKIASPMLTYIPILEKVAAEKKHTFISTGMSTFKDIDEAVDIFKRYNCPFTLMHAVGIYPCLLKYCNIKMVKTLKDRYKCNIGYSGHEAGILSSVLAVVMGATAVERHITLDRTMWGTDQSSSLESRGQELLIRNCNNVSIILGDGKSRNLPDEQKKSQMRWWYG